ncbi:MAG: hypothetical protein ACE5F5_08670 [Acidimicrobiia bacterium]
MTKKTRLESTLTSLGDAIDWPTPSPHLSARVIARIESEEPPVAGRTVWRRPALAAIAVLVVSLVFVFSPSARQAVADLLSVAGIRIGVTSEQTATSGAELNLGELVQLDEVGDRVDFQLRVPGGEDPGVPDAVYLSESGHVTMVWVGTSSLPAAGDTGIGLLLTQYAGNSDQEVAEKAIGPETGVQRLTVEGQPALWIEGAAHTFTLLDTEGNPIQETSRLAANVLLWEADGVNHRLETTGGLQSALAIVTALEPVP